MCRRGAMKSIVKGVLFTSTVLSGLCWAAPVLGQDVPDGDPLVQPASPASTGDIVVTARRRAESIQKVPASVTALSGEGLREREITLVDRQSTRLNSSHYCALR